VAQIGYSDYRPRNYEYFRFASWDYILKLNKKASLIITHGGAGNLIVASHFRKPIVAVPRMRRYGEHVNDHQLQLVRELEKQKRVVAVYKISDLGPAIAKAKRLKSRRKNDSRERKIVSVVRNYIEKVARENKYRK
jgi:UDP-N-acetylglucosamine transferase subunit ALG13